MDAIGPIDWLRIANVALAAHGLVMMFLLRRHWTRLGENERLALIGVGIMWVTMLYAALETVGMNARPGVRVPFITLALLLTSVGLHRQWRDRRRTR